MTAKALLADNPAPSVPEIQEALAGNLCRCTGYQQIYESIEEAARKMRENSPSSLSLLPEGEGNGQPPLALRERGRG